ncbi:CBS domain-containing protein [Desmospora profundinema]|uniref:CBS domain-containing protein n=1 Tax=Desmospora profundinema TaxID=1571184 RepID=A0ABU1IKK9_9BACL|nr:CBS domain-containing protein [Desmospora profundinema]MDR6225298.1 CBS domain-containing protein [Desmospora profundinema]
MNQLREIMTTNVTSVSPQDNISQAAMLMKQHDVGIVPVVENGILQGVVTDRDLVLRSVANQNPNLTVGEVMTNQNLVTGTPNMSVDEASQLMAQHQIRRLPVVENNQLVGIVALGDMAVRQPYADEAGQALTNISVPNTKM